MTTKYKVVLVPFPFDDLSATKVRPAVCLTHPIGAHQHVVLAFITSRTTMNLLDTDLVISLQDPGFSATGLKVTSTLRLHRMMTVTTSFIMRELGRLTPEMQKEVEKRLQLLFFGARAC